MTTQAADSVKKKKIHHDVLVIRDRLDGRRGARLERFAVDKSTGVYKGGPAESRPPVEPEDEGHRPIINLASTGQRTDQDPPRGPILSALPLHPSPAASSGTTCYLVNAQNLNYTTPWTAEEWNDRSEDLENEGYMKPDAFSLLVASPAGKVYYLEKKLDPDGAGELDTDNDRFVFREIALNHESEIWMQLRNGCVVGSAVFEKKPGAASRRDKVVPLVNIDSLTPRKPEEGSK